MESMKNIYKESLFQSISKGEVVLWAGAGLCRAPGWRERPRPRQWGVQTLEACV